MRLSGACSWRGRRGSWRAVAQRCRRLPRRRRRGGPPAAVCETVVSQDEAQLHHCRCRSLATGDVYLMAAQAGVVRPCRPTRVEGPPCAPDAALRAPSLPHDVRCAARAAAHLSRLVLPGRYTLCACLFTRKRTPATHATSGAVKTRCLRSGGLLRVQSAARRGRRSISGSGRCVAMVAPASLFAARTQVRTRAGAVAPISRARATPVPFYAARGANAARMRRAMLRSCTRAFDVAPSRVVNSASRRAATPATAALAVGEVISDRHAEADQSAESSAALIADVLAGLTVTFITLPQALWRSFCVACPQRTDTFVRARRALLTRRWRASPRRKACTATRLRPSRVRLPPRRATCKPAAWP